MPQPKKKNFYLIGTEIGEIVTASVPTRRQVLCLFCHCHFTLSKTILDSAHYVISEIYKFYSNIDIPVMTPSNAKQKLINLYEEWMYLKKNKTRDETKPSPKMTQFSEMLDDNFDITRRKDLTPEEIMKLQLF